MLLNCIKKLGKQINSLDRTDLEEAYAGHIGKGLSEYDASVEAIADFHKIVFDEMNELRGLAAIKPLEYKRYERPLPPVAKTGPATETKTEEATDDGNIALRSVPEDVRNLITAHNLTEANLQFADRLGGLAMPSLAITRKDVGFSGFGDITLIADKSMIDPKAKVPVTDADMYSPRYPSIENNIDEKKFIKLYDGWVKDWVETYGDNLDSYTKTAAYHLETVQTDGIDGILRNEPVALAFLKSTGGKTPKGNEREIRTALSDYVWNNQDSKNEFTEPLTNDLTTDLRMRTGYSSSGRKRYKPADLENIVRQMKSEMKAGEGWNYGAGNVRAAAAKRFKSIAEIQKDRGRIVTAAQLEKTKEQMNERLLEIADGAKASYAYDTNRFSYYDAFTEALADGLKNKRLQRTLEEYGWKGVDMAPIVSYLDTLRNQPTEYFEAKPQRAVRLNEFKAAVVPDTIGAKARKVLEKNGINIVAYKRGDAESRQQAVEQAATENEVLFSVPGFEDTEFEQRPVLIEELLKRDADLRGYVEKNNPEPSRKKQEPVVLAMKPRGGIVVEGMRAIAQAISNGKKTIDAMVQANEPYLMSVADAGKQRQLWANRVSDYFRGNVWKSEVQMFDRTPTILKAMGVPSNTLHVTPDVVEKLKGDHGLTAGQITGIFDDLINPMMVFSSATQPKSRVVVSSQKDYNNDPIIIAIKPDGEITVATSPRGEKPKTEKTNILTRAYGKPQSGLQTWINEGRLLYRDTEKGRMWWHGQNRLQLPTRDSRDTTPKKKILTQADFVNQTLFKVRTPEAVAELKTLTQADDFTDIIPKIKTSVDGNTIALESPEAAEAVRTLLALASDGDRGKQPVLEGLFLEPKNVQNLLEAADAFAEAAEENGVDAEPMNEMVRNLAQAAAENGTVKLHVFDDALKHEEIHEGSFLGADGKRFEARYANSKELKSDSVFKRFHKALNNLQGKTSHGVAMEEALAYLGVGDYARFGLSESEAVGILEKLVVGYADANGVESLRNFKPETKLYEAIESYRESQRSSERDAGRSGRDNAGRETGSSETAREPDEDGTGRGETSRSSTADGTAKQAERLEGQKVASFSRILGQDYYYDPQSHEQTEAKAQQLLSDKGTQQAVFEALNGKPKAETMRVVYWELERLNGLADHYLESGDIEAFNAVAEEIAELSSQIVARQVAAGQEIEIAKTLAPLSPEVAILTAMRMKKFATGDPDVTLTDTQTKQIVEIAKELKEANKKLTETAANLKKAERKIKRLESDKEPTRRTPQARLLKEYQAKKPALLQKLREAFPDSPMFNGNEEALRMVADTEVLRSIPEGQLDPEQEALLTEYAAGMILEGVPYDQVISTLNGIAQADVREIHAQAVEMVRPSRPQSDEAKERAKVRNEHYAKAKEFAKTSEPDLSGIAQNAKDNGLDDRLIWAINRLTNGEAKNINDIVRDLRKEFDLDIAAATELAREANRQVTAIRAERRRQADELREITPEMREALNEAKIAKARATYRLNRFLKQMAHKPWLMERFNNDFRAKLVSNWGTQLFNAVQGVTSTTTESVLDLMEATIKVVANPNPDSTLDISAKDAFLPMAYLFANNKQMAELALAEFPEEYYKIHSGLMGDIELESPKLADEAHPATKPLHAYFDKMDVLNRHLSRISGAKMQEMHFRNAMVAASFDQVIRKKSNGTETLKSALANGTMLDYITERDAKLAADKALRVTFAALIDDPVGKALKRGYDIMDKLVPVMLNPVTFARFTYTTTRVMVANPLLGGILDSEKLGGEGYNARSIAKGVLAWSGVAMAYGLLSAFGDDDDKWETITIDGTTYDMRRFFPFSAYVYTAHLIKSQVEGRPLPPPKELLAGYASLETDYFQFGAGANLIGTTYEATQGRKDMGDVGTASSRMAGSYLSGILRFVKPAKDALAQFDDEEAMLRENPTTAKGQFIKEVSKTLPIVGRSLAPQIDALTDEPIKTKAPMARWLGVNVVHPSFLSAKQTPATEWAEKVFQFTPTAEWTDEQRKAFIIRKRLRTAVYRGEVKAKDLDARIDKFVTEGKLTKRSANILRQDLNLSELQYRLKYGYKPGNGNPKMDKALDRVTSVATEQEKADIEAIIGKRIKKAKAQ